MQYGSCAKPVLWVVQKFVGKSMCDCGRQFVICYFNIASKNIDKGMNGSKKFL